MCEHVVVTCGKKWRPQVAVEATRRIHAIVRRKALYRRHRAILHQFSWNWGQLIYQNLLESVLSFRTPNPRESGVLVDVAAYLAASEDKSLDYDTATFWKTHRSSLPTWATALSKVLLVQPSSAAPERIFSTFGDQQYRSLQGYIEASLMLQYSKRKWTGTCVTCVLSVYMLFSIVQL